MKTWLKLTVSMLLASLPVLGGVATAQTPATPATPAEGAAPAPASRGKGELPAFTDADARVYQIHLKGEFGRDVHINPLRQVMNDAKRFQPDIILIKVDTDFSVFGQQRQEFSNDAGMAFNQLEQARSLSLLFTDEVRDDPEWQTRSGEKPRLIMWVKRAMGGSAFLPFVAKDIYYAPGSHHGGIGYLERTLSTGDKVVHEKMYAARLGRAEGLALKGGHDPRILRAMARSEYVLSVSFVNGQPVFYEDESGDLLLTNDPAANSKNVDTMEDILRMRGKNVLTLDPETALKIGLSKGTVETVDDLAVELGIARSFVVVPGRSEALLERWGRDVAEAERNLNRIWREYQRIRPEGDTPQMRNRGRSQQINRLNEIKSLLERFSGAINPYRLEGFPPNAEAFDRRINDIREEMRRDR